MEKVNDQLLIIFGASGDLTSRKLLPSLFQLYLHDLLPERFCILGASRTPYADEEYRALQRTELPKRVNRADFTEKQLEGFLDLLYYVTLNTTKSEEYTKLQHYIEFLREKYKIADRILFYLATPPVLYETIPQCLWENKLNVSDDPQGWRRIIVEKPFGSSLASAQELSTHLRKIFHEEEVYRIDHYLGKETVQNILVLRFSNGIFEPLWNHNFIDSVEISITESIGVENRGKYYDHAGALRDMIQNHLMQLMAFVAMESPAVFETEPIQDEIVKVFRSLRPYKETEIDSLIVRGQYEGYRSEKNISSDSNTETYVAMKFFIDNWRWSGVPFYFVTGKKMPDKRSEIVINFKSTPHHLFIGQCSGSSCNQLILSIQPDEGISLRFGLKEPGSAFTVRQVSMDFQYHSLSGVRLPDAYERLLMDAMIGDTLLYTRSDASEASWKFIDPVLTHWQEERENGLFYYPPGEDGPREKNSLGLIGRRKDCQSNPDGNTEL